MTASPKMRLVFGDAQATALPADHACPNSTSIIEHCFDTQTSNGLQEGLGALCVTQCAKIVLCIKVNVGGQPSNCIAALPLILENVQATATQPLSNARPSNTSIIRHCFDSNGLQEGNTQNESRLFCELPPVLGGAQAMQCTPQQHIHDLAWL